MASSSSSAATSAVSQHRSHEGAISGAGGMPSPPPPPPTPSNQSTSKSVSADADAAFSRFLNQLLLAPTAALSLSSPAPPRRSPPPTVISWIQSRGDQLHLLRTAAAGFGFFHLTDLGVPFELADFALVEAQTLMQRSSQTPTSSLSSLDLERHDFADDDHRDVEEGEADSNDKDQILALETGENCWESLPALRDYGNALKGLAMEVVEMLSSMEGGFPGNPFGRGTDYTPRCLIWVSEGTEDCDIRSKLYPYVVGLHLMTEERQPCRLVGDCGELISVPPRDGSLLVTLGDIAQVWSNGRFKKVNGRPRSSVEGRSVLTMSFLLTLSLDTVISPLLPLSSRSCRRLTDDSTDDGCDDDTTFMSFPLEEYAWRIYNERRLLKDPLLRYRI